MGKHVCLALRRFPSLFYLFSQNTWLGSQLLVNTGASHASQLTWHAAAGNDELRIVTDSPSTCAHRHGPRFFKQTFRNQIHAVEAHPHTSMWDQNTVSYLSERGFGRRERSYRFYGAGSAAALPCFSVLASLLSLCDYLDDDDDLEREASEEAHTTKARAVW